MKFAEGLNVFAWQLLTEMNTGLPLRNTVGPCRGFKLLLTAIDQTQTQKVDTESTGELY